MKLKTCLLLAATCVGLPNPAPAAETFRTDINPALLYWQAFAAVPDLGPEDTRFFFETDWRTRPMDDRAGELVVRFDSTFRLMRQAAAAKVPCDWGVDLSEGPRTLLSHLAKAKRCAQAAILRARWFVQHGQQDAARDDLVGAYVLGRNLAQDQVLISALVQFAIENIVTGYMAQEWPQLAPQTIGALLESFEKAPPRGTIAATIRTERTAFYAWLLRSVDAFRAKYPTDETAALNAIAQLLDETVSEEGQRRKGFGAKLIAAAGGSIEGVTQYIREVEPFYAETEQLMKLPYAEFQPAIADLQQRVQTHPNLLLQEFFPAFLKVRNKEFRTIARLAMVQAAYQHRLDPQNGLKKVADPFGDGPFEFQRFVLESVDRGFKLKSRLSIPDFDEVLIFAERPGAPFYIDGPNAGQKLP